MADDLRLFISKPELDAISTAEFGYLNLKIPGGSEQEFTVSKSEITVGRAQTNDIHIEDAKMSRTNARFELCNEREARVIDTKSSNGVWVNGIKVTEVTIKPGDVILMGGSQIQYESLPDEDDGLTIIDN
ncbi:MAG TPA: FHA domain-containing protein [Anaerolineales bacterium]|nr:FHA domain-containing protein [Anaerolineales bacterium]